MNVQNYSLYLMFCRLRNNWISRRIVKGSVLDSTHTSLLCAHLFTFKALIGNLCSVESSFMSWGLEASHYISDPYSSYGRITDL